MIFERQINRRIKKELVRHICSFLRFSLFVDHLDWSYFLSYIIIWFLLRYYCLPWHETNENRQRERERETGRKKRERIYLSCSSFFFYIPNHSFIIFFSSLSGSLSFSLWLLSIKYYPEATRTRKDSTSHRLFWLEYKDSYKG